MYQFIMESNKIEGIDHTNDEEVAAYRLALDLDRLSVYHLMAFLEVIQPGAQLRCRPGMNVTVGGFKPMLGGPMVESELRYILERINDKTLTPLATHIMFERLHPFTDGNGRTGRMIWLWQMIQLEGYDGGLGFLHKFYYQVLAGI